MKINIEMELSPQEARELFGLPDLQGVQQTLLKQFTQQAQDSSPEQLQSLMQPFLNQSQLAMSGYQNLMQALLNASNAKSENKD